MLLCRRLATVDGSTSFFFDSLASEQPSKTIFRIVRRTQQTRERKGPLNNNLKIRKTIRKKIVKRGSSTKLRKVLFVLRKDLTLKTQKKRHRSEREPKKQATHKKLAEKRNSREYKKKKQDPNPHLEKPTYTQIVKNIFVHRNAKKWSKKDVPVCNCRPMEGQVGCGDNCLNRVMFYECDPQFCPCGSKCTNKRFRKRLYADVELFKTERKGWGLKAKDFIPDGSFVIEYVGEVIDQRMCQERLSRYQELGVKNFYFLTLEGSEYIDASNKGNRARFINHSCNPNCVTRKWWVDGELRVGIFAEEDILPGEEITFDYQFERFGGDKQPCFCGEPNCRGFLGAKKKKMVVPTNIHKKKKLQAIRYIRSSQQRTKANILTPAAIVHSLLNPSHTLLNHPTPTTPPIFLRRNSDRVRAAMVEVYESLLETHSTA